MFAYSNEYAQFCGRNPWAPAQMRLVVNKRPLLGTAERRPGLRPSLVACEGFSLLEMMVSIALIMEILGGVFFAISSSQQSYARTELKSDMYGNVPGAAELMAQ